MIARLELGRRLERAGQAVAYLLANVPIAVLGLLAVIALILGAALSVIGIGLPIVLGAAAACRWLVRLDRRTANSLLGTQIPPLPGGRPTSGSPWRRSLDVLSDRVLWRAVAVLATKPLLIGVLLAAALAPVVLLAELLNLGVQGLFGLGGIDYLGPWSFGLGTGIVLLLLALPAAVIAVATLEALRTLLCTITRALVAPRVMAAGPVREMLAESLGDRSVAVAYWLPDREVFVDEVGKRVTLPDAGSGRAWTAVERDGRPVAAIVHDAALDTSRELVQAAAAASSLAIDNERLKADLRARLEELRVSRLRIVEATDAARRRIERDLHDGAQQQLVSLRIELRTLKTRMNAMDPETTQLVDRLGVRLEEAISELRELARGIHPAVLTERGLAPAVETLAERTPVSVEREVSVDERLPARLESAAYFTVAEALTNVVKYAKASKARVEIRRDGGELVVTVADDGIGGADMGKGTGLSGLQDRLAAVDATLTVDSPPNGGTRVVARLPVGDGAGEIARRAEEVSA
ncbi:MAG: sensor histidine kinase [Thermoleophilaceae bacterium]